MKYVTITPFAACILLSLTTHVGVVSFLDKLRPFDLTRPVMVSLADLTELGETTLTTDPGQTAQLRAISEYRTTKKFMDKVQEHILSKRMVSQQTVKAAIPALQVMQDRDDTAEKTQTDAETVENVTPSPAGEDKSIIKSVDSPLKASGKFLRPSPPIRTASEFVTVKREKLTYRIIMFGIPVGSAILEAVNEGGGVKISSTVSSNAVISGLYPVSDYAETRLMGGRYIINRVRQREGTFTGDAGFTLDLREKTVYWIDRLRNRFDTQALPNEEVLDIISGFYYLRNRPLEVGKSLVLQLFDSNKYVPTIIEVLRKEHISLPGFRESETLVIHPLITTDGVFRNAEDILVWLTDDEHRVPVRFETTIPLGRVRAELIAAEVDAAGK